MNSCWPPTSSSRPTIIKISMALLYRFTKLNDRFNTGIFTFIVTRSVTRDLHRDATTKDFYYGYHRWAISFTRANDRALGVFLLLRNPSPSTKCYADFTLTLLNREHFSRNEQHVEKQCKFTTERTTQGVNKWIMISEIQSRKFGDETGEFLLELSLGNIMTIFETDLQVSNNDGQLKSGKFESASFTFGSFEWNVSIVIHNYGSSNLTASIFGGNSSQNNDSGEHQQNQQQQSNANRIIYVFLNRLSGFDHPCRVQYRVMIGGDDGTGGDNVSSSKKQEDSGVLDQISDAGGRIRGFQMQHSLSDLLKPNGAVSVHVELHCCNAISEAKVPIIRNPSPTINCYDRNKQGWCIEADMDSEYLRLKLFFMDLHSVPRNHLRYISWIAYVIAKDPRHGIRESLAVSNAPHSNYYVQDGIDMGAMMDTTLTVAKIKETPKIYLESEKLTVHVEWCDSIMLFNHIYHKYDDITRIHGHQMRREIIALSSENYSLEKQLVSYQKTIGNTMMTMANNASANRSMSKENNQSDSGSIKGQQQQQQQQQQHHHHHHHNHHNHHQQPQQTQQPQPKSGQEIGIDPNVDSTLQQSGSQHHQQQQQQLLQLHQKQLIQKHRMERGSIGGDAPPPMLAAVNVRDNSMAAGIGGQTHQSAAQPAISQHHQHPPHQQNQQSYYHQSTTPPLAGGGGRHLLNHQQQQQQHHHHHHKLPAIPTVAAAKYAVPGTQLTTQHQMHQYQKDDDNSSMYIVVPQIINNAHNHNPIRKLHHGSLPNTSSLQQDSFDAATNAYYANNNNANSVQPSTIGASAIGGGGLGEFDDFSGLSRSVNSLTPPLTHTPRMHRSSLHRSRERNYPNSTTSIPMAVHQSPLSNYGGGHHASTMINNTVSYHMQRSSLIQHHHHHQHPPQQVMFQHQQQQQQQHNVHFGPTSMMMMNSAPNISANGQPINGWTAVEGGDETSQAAMISYGSNYYT